MVEDIVALGKSSSLVPYHDDGLKFAKKVGDATVIEKKASIKNVSDGFQYAQWFTDSLNTEPSRILALMMSNNMSMPILTTKSKFVVGNGLVAYKNIVESGKSRTELWDIPEISDTIEQFNLNELMYKLCLDRFIFGNSYLAYLMTKDGTDVADMYHLDASTVRAEARSARGKIEHYFVSSDWMKPKYGGEGANTVRIPSSEKKGAVAEFVYQMQDYTPGFPYYSLPEWYGSWDWISLSNLIATWHKSGLSNGYSVRFLIEISNDMFKNLPEKEVAPARQRLQQSLDECLASPENAGRTMFVSMQHQYYIDKGLIRITPIEFDLHDGAFSTLFGDINTASTSGFGIDPSLCGIQTQGKLSSGSEKRESYLIWLLLQSPRLRDILLGGLAPLIEIKGWKKKFPGLKFGFRNVELTKLDENPTGSQSVITS